MTASMARRSIKTDVDHAAVIAEAIEQARASYDSWAGRDDVHAREMLERNPTKEGYVKACVDATRYRLKWRGE